MHVLVVGGGTGGHVFPAIAVAAELRKRGHRVSWAGRTGGMEESLVRSADVPFYGLSARPWLGKSAMSKLSAAATLAGSSIRGRRLIRELDVDAVFGTGGYVSAPAIFGARLAGRSAYLFEPNARAGAANRVVSRWCREAFTAYEMTGPELRCPSTVTGIPVRQEFYEIGPVPQGPPHLLVLGGSQGALQVNELLPPVIARLLRENPQLTVTHQTGKAHIERVGAAYDRALQPADRERSVKLVSFLNDVAGEMERSHLVVSRAGALASAEVSAAGRPSILVPLVAVAGGHQRYNAERLEEAGAAVVLAGEGLNEGSLYDRLRTLLSDRNGLEAMASAARSLARPGAVRTIVDRLTAPAASTEDRF